MRSNYSFSTTHFLDILPNIFSHTRQLISKIIMAMDSCYITLLYFKAYPEAKHSFTRLPYENSEFKKIVLKQGLGPTYLTKICHNTGIKALH
jgi:hypothetical protein